MSEIGMAILQEKWQMYQSRFAFMETILNPKGKNDTIGFFPEKFKSILNNSPFNHLVSTT